MGKAVLLILLLVLAIGLSGCVEPQTVEDCLSRRDTAIRDYCFEKLAHTKKDITICENIGDQRYLATCYGPFVKTKEDLVYCDRLTDEFENSRCYGAVAIRTRDIQICELIEADISRETCYMELGKRTQDLSLCEKIEDLPLKSRCIEHVNIFKGYSEQQLKEVYGE